MSKVVSLRLGDEQARRLERLARRDKQTTSAMVALMLEEALREREFPRVCHRETGAGRRAFVRGTRLKVWHVASLFEAYGGDALAVAEHVGVPSADVEEALRYAAAFPDEIGQEVAENDRRAAELMQEIDTQPAPGRRAAAS